MGIDLIQVYKTQAGTGTVLLLNQWLSHFLCVYIWLLLLLGVYPLHFREIS